MKDLCGIEEFKARLRSCKMKVTPQRVTIFQALAKTRQHPGAESLFNEVRKVFPEMSRATVYSALKSLEKKGLIQEIGTFGDIRRFEGNPKPHPHLICIRCNKIEDLEGLDKEDIANLQSSVSRKTGYKLADSFLSLWGYCPGCKNKIKKPRIVSTFSS